jgi:hypothetical protein
LCLVALFFVAAPAAHAVTFSNSAPITINDAGAGDTPAAATPYPSSINVSGVTGTPSIVELTLHGFSHACPTDVDMLLVGPHGQSSILMSDTGDCSSNPRPPIELSFENGLGQIPCIPQGSLEVLAAGAYAPTNRAPTDSDACNSINPGNAADVFATPAPPGPWQANLAPLAAADPNGSWQLFVMDQYNEDAGSIGSGWSLFIGITPPQLVNPPTIGGVPEVGKSITAHTGSILNQGQPTWQWSSCQGTTCTAIPGATSDTYKPAKADRGKTLEVSERAVNSGGTTAALTSARSKPVGPPRLSSSSKSRQRILKQKGVIVTALSDLGGTLRATGTISVPKTARVVRLAPVKRTLKAKKRAAVKLGLTKAGRKAIAQALANGAKLKAKIKLVVTDAGGGKSTSRRTITLKR